MHTHDRFTRTHICWVNVFNQCLFVLKSRYMTRKKRFLWSKTNMPKHCKSQQVSCTELCVWLKNRTTLNSFAAIGSKNPHNFIAIELLWMAYVNYIDLPLLCQWRRTSDGNQTKDQEDDERCRQVNLLREKKIRWLNLEYKSK